jgi:hypothetical protein
MAAEFQQSPNFEFTAETLEAVFQTLSESRLKTYLIIAGYDRIRALKLYMWNAQIGEAFHIPIQSLEVALRNRINAALTNQFGNEWWKAPEFLAIADEERKIDLSQVLKRIQNRKIELCTDQVVAGLSFGFWVGMLHGRYNPPLWGAQLRTAFPNLPLSRSRKSLAQETGKIAFLRNRIWHHEPIIKRNLLDDYRVVMTTLEWICPTTAAWVRPHCRIPELIRVKP